MSGTSTAFPCELLSNMASTGGGEIAVVSLALRLVIYHVRSDEERKAILLAQGLEMT